MTSKLLDDLRLERRCSLASIRQNVVSLCDYSNDSRILTDIAKISKKLYDLSDLIELDYKLMINQIKDCEAIKERDLKLARIAKLQAEIDKLRGEL